MYRIFNIYWNWEIIRYHLVFSVFTWIISATHAGAEDGFRRIRFPLVPGEADRGRHASDGRDYIQQKHSRHGLQGAHLRPQQGDFRGGEAILPNTGPTPLKKIYLTRGISVSVRHQLHLGICHASSNKRRLTSRTNIYCIFKK